MMAPIMITIQELLAFGPFLEASFLSSGGRERSFSTVTWVEEGTIDSLQNSMNSSEIHRDLKQAFLIVATDKQIKWESIETILKLEPCAIFIAGESVKRDSVVGEQDIGIPIVALPDQAKEKIVQTVRLIQFLKAEGIFYSYLKEMSGSYLSFYHDHGPSSLVRSLSHLLGRSLIIVSNRFEIVLPFDEQKMEWEKKVGSWRKIIKRPLDDPIYGEGFAVFAIANQKSTLGYIFVETKHSPLDSFEVELLTMTLPIFSTFLNQEEKIAEVKRQFKETFLYDLFHNNIESTQSLIKQGTLWGWDFRLPYHLLLLQQFQQEEPKSPMLSEVRRVLASYLSAHLEKAIVEEMFNQLVILVPDIKVHSEDSFHRLKELATSIIKKIEQTFPDLTVKIGIGRSYASSMQLYRSYHEAKTALELSRFSFRAIAVACYEELGAMRLIASLNSDLLLDYYNTYIGKLAEFDAENQMDLIHTLKIFVEESGEIKRTADRLHLHTNTLRYRLKKIEGILHIHLDNWDDLFNVMMAVKISQVYQ